MHFFPPCCCCAKSYLAGICLVPSKCNATWLTLHLWVTDWLRRAFFRLSVQNVFYRPKDKQAPTIGVTEIASRRRDTTRCNGHNSSQFTRDGKGEIHKLGVSKRLKQLQSIDAVNFQAMADQKKSKFHQPEGAQHSSHPWFRCAFMTWVVLNPRKVWFVASWTTAQGDHCTLLEVYKTWAWTWKFDDLVSLGFRQTNGVNGAGSLTTESLDLSLGV